MNLNTRNSRSFIGVDERRREFAPGHLFFHYSPFSTLVPQLANMLGRGADPHLTDRDGSAPSDIVSQQGNLQAVALISPYFLP